MRYQQDLIEAVRVGVDTPSPTPIDMVSGKLDSLLRRPDSIELKI